MSEKVSVSFAELTDGRVAVSASIPMLLDDNLSNIELIAKITMLRSSDLLDSCSRSELLQIVEKLEEE